MGSIKGGDSMLGLIANIPVQEGKVEEAIEMFGELMIKVAEEEGTLSYTLNRSNKDPNTLVVMERYKDKTALDFHSTTPHFKEFSSRLPAILAGKPEINVLEEILST
jgi:quinol monooxygenase YgiN